MLFITGDERRHLSKEEGSVNVIALRMIIGKQVGRQELIS